MSKYEHLNASLNRTVLQEYEHMKLSGYLFEIIFFIKINETKYFRYSILHALDYYIFQYNFYDQNHDNYYREAIPINDKSISISVRNEIKNNQNEINKRCMKVNEELKRKYELATRVNSYKYDDFIGKIFRCVEGVVN